ncbi:hypothetical protein GGI25_001185 [Coemansia spiralis]|uniref:Protein phosphatase n=2 Tax=Coemansia TaxID=4863 RepID=A0A9W8L085_9FUNG|nr:hypothetical protein EDC05_006119 [Coemansia umbellata]KAJ2624680.1 hypothetical protein GGI26_001374 [Coemansia sp. RSA 1358]KAJ2679734.1 hypothetical protein GGI25_001185 [Coemansia spiralis]
MGADSKHLSRALLRLTKDVHTRSSLQRTRRYTTTTAAAHSPQCAALSSRGIGGAVLTEEGWFLKLSRKLQERRDRLIGWNAPSPKASAANLTAAHEKQTQHAADKLAASSASGRQPGKGGTAQVRHRRWIAWKPAASWDFPTLNSSFPFTIPSVPVNLFLFASPGTHVSVPSGVIMPSGLGTSARKFHSMSLTRQPGVPFDNYDGGSALLDPAVIAAHILQADAASKARLAYFEKTQPSGAQRRSDGAASSTRSRVSKNYMFTHAATGIPKFETRIPLPKKGKTSSSGSRDLQTKPRYSEVIDPSEEEMATSAGEDAFFHRYDALGIADGVGGWAGVKDADPSLFARRLMHHVNLEIQRYDDIDDEMFSHYYEAAPVDILRRAYEFTLDEMEALTMRGSSTACVVVLRGDELRVANLGDCGLTVVRQGDMVYRTEEQQHSFNYPYQLGTEAHSDRPSDAQVFRLKIQKGDIIIVGSDGVFDNLFDEDILEEVNQHLPPVMRATGEPELKYSSDSLWYESQQSDSKLEAICQGGNEDVMVAPAPGASKIVATTPKFTLPQFHVDPKAISLAIAKRARLVSEDARYTESPFQMRAMQEGLYYQGGKRDDITVIVAVVTDLEDTPDRR